MVVLVVMVVYSVLVQALAVLIVFSRVIVSDMEL
jgi:hypothetical protein